MINLTKMTTLLSIKTDMLQQLYNCHHQNDTRLEIYFVVTSNLHKF